MTELTLAQQLEAPMPFKWKPQGKPKKLSSGPVNLGVPYITSAEARHRLNEVFGADGWWPVFTTLQEYSEETTARNGQRKLFVCSMDCSITAAIPQEDGSRYLVAKGNTGVGRSETIEDARKSAYSDSLKRAASVWGVGQFLEFIPKRELPCVLNENGYFAAWAESVGEVLPEIDRRLDLIIDDYEEDLSITKERLEGRLGPRSAWTADTLFTLQIHHAQLMLKRNETKIHPPKEVAAGSPDATTPAAPSSTSEWLTVYPNLRGDTRAMVEQWVKLGWDWRDLETESGLKLPHLSRQEVAKLFEDIRREFAKKGKADATLF